MRPLIAIWLTAWAVTSGQGITPQTPRDAPRQSRIGRGSISGIVMTDDADPRPVRRARVFLNDDDDEISRTTISDDAGRFSFAELPSGRYLIGAAKDGYVQTRYGARRPDGPGAPVTLANGAALTDIAIPLVRGAVITGTLLDPEGQPIPGVSMRALRYTYTANGERRLTPVTTTMASHITDDRGLYRIYGLPPGEYTIAAPAIPQFSSGDEILMMTESDVRRALDEVRQVSRQGMSLAETASVAPATGDEPRAAGYATVFYPGTIVPSQSLMIPLGRAEERTGVDFQLQYVPMSTIRGTAIGPPNMMQSLLTIHLIGTDDVLLSDNNGEGRTTSVAGRGEFHFVNVPPGAYTVVAKAAQSAGAVFWAAADVVVDGQSQPEIALAMQPGLTVAGRVLFDGRAPVPNPSTIHVTLAPLLSGSQISLASTPARVDANGRFSIAGVTAGRYRLQATIDGQPGWMLSSSNVSGRDALDVPVDIRQSVDGAVVTFSDRAAELSGAVRDGSGGPIAGGSVILFSADRTLWTPKSRRIRAAQAGADGAFQFRLLPPGEYYVAAIVDLDEGAWYDPVVLDRLAAASAVKVTIAEGEKKTVDVVGQSSPGK